MKTVIIGTGRMGRRHIQVVHDLGLKLVGICDQSSESLAVATEEYNIPADHQSRDVPTMLRKTRPRLVIVSTTAPSHCEYTCMAAEMGVEYILCEKPMAVSLAECDRMIDTCHRHGAKLAINHQMRYMYHYAKSKEIIDSKPFGGICSVSVVGGNFGMAMNGLHYFEMFRFMTDDSPSEAIAWFSGAKISNPRGEQFEDKAGSIRLITTSGKRFYMEIGDDQGHGLMVIYAGSYGLLVVNELTGTMYLSVREEQYLDLPTTRYAMPSTETTIKIAPTAVVEPTRALIKDLLRGRGYTSGEDGRLAISSLVAAYLSSENGSKPVLIQDKNLPRERVFPWA